MNFKLTACDHEFTDLRWRNRSSGLIGWQCVECKKLVGKWLKHSDVRDAETLPDWDETETPQAANDNRQMLHGLDGSGKYVDTAAYGEYLGSDLWRRRRQKVLERAGGVCEGCLTNPATQVHHLTYAHIYNELAFELVALCAPCHERAHSK